MCDYDEDNPFYTFFETKRNKKTNDSKLKSVELANTWFVGISGLEYKGLNLGKIVIVLMQE